MVMLYLAKSENNGFVGTYSLEAIVKKYIKGDITEDYMVVASVNVGVQKCFKC